MIEFVGASAQDTASKNSNTSRLVNLWADKVEDGGRTRRLLRSTLGMETYANASAAFCRAMYNLNGNVYAVIGAGLYGISEGSAALNGAVDFGDGDLSRNGAILTVTSGGKYYNWNGSALTLPTPGAFSAFGSVDFMAGRTLLTEQNGNKIQWSDIGAPQTLGGLNVATAESRPDKIIRGVVSGGVYYVMGAASVELWAPTGEGGANAFALIPGAVVDTGLKAFGLVTQVDGGLFMVGDDNIVYLMAGTETRPVSIAPVNTAIKDGTPQACVYWEDRGHKFAAVTFSDRPAWVYTITTGEWWERAEGTDYQPWRAQASVKVGQDWLVGANDGSIARLRGVEDFGGTLCREMTSFPIYSDGKWFSIAECEFFGKSGYDDASLVLEVSRDGATFGLQRTLPISEVGNHLLRTVFRNLGRSRQFVLRATLTDPVDVPLWASVRMRAA